MKNIYFVRRKKGNTVVALMFNRMDNKYHFVNLKKSHIYICGFSSVEDAINDLKRLKETGEIIDYYKINENDACIGYDEKFAKWLEELHQYQVIEEYIDAREKQFAKKPDIFGDGYDNEGNIIYDSYSCPACNKIYEIDYEDYKYCPNCGQKLDLSDFD